jgi:hypothetical protein
MTLIEALLLLPERGEPNIVNREVATALAGSSAKIVQRRGKLWSLTDDGRRFLAQFRYGRSDTITEIVVRLVVENGEPLFHLLCDDDILMKVDKTDLQRSLRKLQAANPGMKVAFDFRPSRRVS